MWRAAVLFDMDGVVIDTHHTVTAFWHSVAKQHGVQISEADFIQNIYGCPAQHTLDVLFPTLSQAEQERVHAVLLDYETNQQYAAMRGVLPLLQSLQMAQVPTALVTSGARWKVEAVAAQIPLKDLFDAYVTIDDITHGKPHPECYLLAAEKLGIPAEDSLVFEDSLSGAQAAITAGAACVGVQLSAGAKPLLNAGARAVIADFDSVVFEPGQKVLQLNGSTEPVVFSS